MGEAGKDALRVDFDRAVKLAFHGARASSDVVLFPYRAILQRIHRFAVTTPRAGPA